MRSAFLNIALLLLPVSMCAQINPNQIAWPKPACDNPEGHWAPGASTCVTTTSTGGLPANNPQYSGTMIGPTAIVNSLQAKGSPWWDVTAYGADPTGVADSTAAFNNQLATCLTSGGTVFAPAGAYLVTGINMIRAAYNQNRCTLAGAGRDATTITITQAGGIGINALGASNITVRDLSVSTANLFGRAGRSSFRRKKGDRPETNATPIVIQTGMLLARSSTSTTAGYDYIENVNFLGQFSNCGLVSIAAEGHKRHNVHIENLYGSGSYPYCAFATSGSNDFGITVPSGTIYASSNTDNETWGDEFYCDRGPNALCSVYSNGAGYRNFGQSIEVSNGNTGGIAVQFQNTAANIFNGPVEFYGPHFECNNCILFYLKGLAGTYNFFNAVRVDGGNFVIYAPGLNYLVSGNDSSGTSTYNVLAGWQISTPNYIGGNGAGALGIYIGGITNGSHLYLRPPNSSAATIVNASQFVQGGSTVEASVIDEPNGAFDPQTTVTPSGFPTPQSGLYAAGHIVKNGQPTGTTPLSWTVTTAGYVAKEAWTTGHSYSGGDYVTNVSNLYYALTAGAAGATPPTATSGTVSDGTVTWLYVGPATTPAVFSSNLGVVSNSNGAQYLGGSFALGAAPQPGANFQATNNGSSQYNAYGSTGEGSAFDMESDTFQHMMLCSGAVKRSGTWYATNTTANCITTFAGNILFFQFSGLTVGASFNPSSATDVCRIQLGFSCGYTSTAAGVINANNGFAKGTSAGISQTISVGPCSFTVAGGIITGASGCAGITLSALIASSSSNTLATSVAANSCDASPQTFSATGAITGDRVPWAYNGDPTTTLGFGGGTNGGIRLVVWASTNTVNVKRCNDTAAPIVPGAVSIAWAVERP